MKMALLNRLFPTKKKSHKQGYVPFGKNEYSGWKPFNFTREQVRLLLFRECDARGRKLLFDSSAVQKTTIENNQPSKLKLGSKSKGDTHKKAETYVEVTNGFGYQYTRPSPDVTLMGEMIFGSVAMTFKGMTCKLHCMKSPDRFMCSRVFSAPAIHFNNKRRSDQSIDSSGSSVNSLSDSFSHSGNYETKSGGSCTGPLDVPLSENSVKALTSSLEGDSGFCGDASLHSVSSMGSGFWGTYPCGCDSQNGSHSTLGNNSNSGGSLASLQRRWMRNVSTSLEVGATCSLWNFMKCRNSSGVSDEGISRSHRKTQLGLTVVISLSPEEERDMEMFFFEHMALIESMLERLQNNVEKAYIKKDVFVHLMMDAFHELQQWFCDLFTAPRLSSPIWIGLVSSADYNRESSRLRFNLASTFLRDFCQLIAAIDTKATNFFISTLVTAVLTHHLGWVATILPAKAPPSSVTKPQCTVQMLHALAKSHPYNALWAQLGDLHGAVGNPVKIARTVVTANGKRNDLLNKLLNSLSYFIRCGKIEKRIDNNIAVDNDTEFLDSVMESLSSASLNSSTASTSTIVPDDAPNRGQESEFLIGECRILNSSEVSLNAYSEEAENKGNLSNEKNAVVFSEATLADSPSATSFKRSTTFTKSLNCSSFEAPNSDNSEKSNHKLYPDISFGDDSHLHPDVISQKVSRLCRVPTNAVLYHMKSEPSTESVKSFLPKKVDCEKQLSSVKAENNRARIAVPLVNQDDFDSLSKHSSDKTDQTNQGGVIFVLGDNEELVDLKNQSGLTLPKSKSDNILCGETEYTKVNRMKKSSCYPSLEKLEHLEKGENEKQILESKTGIVVNRTVNMRKKENAAPPEGVAPTTNSDIPGEKCFSDSEETALDSGIVLEEETSASKFVNSVSVHEKVDVWENDRTRKSISEGNSLVVGSSVLFNDINGNPRTDENENSNCKVVTSRSFVIELEDVHGSRDTKASKVRRKLSKQVARSQSLSFPDRKSVSCKKSVNICRRHSENIHVNERYLKDYRSVRFNFERCDGVLDDYVDGIGVEKSPQTEKKSIKLSEARGNFELQEKMCEKCKHRKQGVSLDTVLCSSGGVCDCGESFSASKDYGCEEGGVSQEADREGNALFDDYGRLSDDELLSSTEMPDDRGPENRPDENMLRPSLVELPLPQLRYSQLEQGSGLAASLLGGVSDHYMPDMVLHACTQPLPQWEAALKRDLVVSAHRPMLDQEVSEAVCIVGNAELWEVQLVSSHVSVVDKPGGFGIRVGMSQLVANMLESLLHLWKLRVPPEQCLQHLESKLRELCLRSQALAELLLTTQFCDLVTVTSSLGLEANDVPLLLAIASTHTPQVTNHYGVSFR